MQFTHLEKECLLFDLVELGVIKKKNASILIVGEKHKLDHQVNEDNVLFWSKGIKRQNITEYWRMSHPDRKKIYKKGKHIKINYVSNIRVRTIRTAVTTYKAPNYVL